MVTKTRKAPALRQATYHNLPDLPQFKSKSWVPLTLNNVVRSNKDDTKNIVSKLATKTDKTYYGRYTPYSLVPSLQIHLLKFLYCRLRCPLPRVVSQHWNFFHLH